MENTNTKLHEIDQKYYLQTFKRFPITLVKGKGARVWDVDGKEYVDTMAGIAVNCIGHNHPNLVKAIKNQAENLIHISNFYLSEPQALLAKKLSEVSGMDRIFFCNSGAEAAEGAIKIARKYANSKGKGGKIISMGGSFHGRTLATIAAGKKALQDGFDPIPEGFVQVPFNDIEAVKNAYSEDVAGVIIEPIQGEGGINVADMEFMKQLREFCYEKDISLIFDEIQTGVGRTGKWYAKDHFGIQPDIMTSAKGLGGGVPIGAILSNDKVSSALNYGDHGTTFGGNPLACAAGLAVLNTIKEEKLLDAALEKGDWIREQIEEINDPSVQRIKGKGLMIGVEFDFETKPLVEEMMKNGVLANATAGNILRVVPPLNITYNELEKFINVLKKSLTTIKNKK